VQPQWQSRPTTSPYLNLLRPGAAPAINYFGLVQPQINTSQNISQLQQQVGVLDSTLLNSGMTTNAPTAGSVLTTGHPVVFFNYGAYFPMPGRGRIGGGAGGLGARGVGGVGGGGLVNAGFPLGIGVGFNNR
jgi:hypothetical protein